MKVWHDWEFLENGTTIRPISVGMIRQDGKELYRVFSEAPWFEINDNAWLKANVLPGLNATVDNVGSKSEIRTAVTEFLKEAYDKDHKLELWGWYSAYDHVCLAQLFGKMIDLPDWCPMLTRDLKQEFLRVHADRSIYIPQQTTGLHNALEDARHLKVKHEWFEGYERGIYDML